MKIWYGIHYFNPCMREQGEPSRVLKCINKSKDYQAVLFHLQPFSLTLSIKRINWSMVGFSRLPVYVQTEWSLFLTTVLEILFNESSGVVAIILIASLGKYLRDKIKQDIESTGNELIDKFFGALELNMNAI